MISKDYWVFGSRYDWAVSDPSELNGYLDLDPETQSHDFDSILAHLSTAMIRYLFLVLKHGLAEIIGTWVIFSWSR